MKITDEQHEEAIQVCFHEWLEGRASWSDLRALIAQRSAEQIARMEREKGLAR